MCNISIPWYYDLKKKEWVHTGFSEPTLFISTELDEEEMQTLAMAYVSGVNESTILDGSYTKEEEERVDKAISYIESSPFYIEIINDFGIRDIENIIKKYKREYNCSHVCFDYVHISAKLMGEIASVTNGTKLREDQVLFLFIDMLKNLCVTLDVFILTMTQLNGSYKDSNVKDETMLRGSKSMADRLDGAEISLPPNQAELKSIEPIMKKMVGTPKPTLVRHIYKVRRGKLTRVRVWQHADLGTCRTVDLFVTTNDYELIPVTGTEIDYITPEEQKVNVDIDKAINDNSISIDEISVSDEEQKEAVTTLFNW